MFLLSVISLEKIEYRDKVDSATCPGTEGELTVARARKIQKFLSQPFSVAEIFTGAPGKYVSLADTIRGFKEILEGKHDDKLESAFYMKGGIEEV